MKYKVVANNVSHFKLLNQLELDTIILASKYSSYRNSFSLDEIEECFMLNQNISISFYDLISETIIDEVVEYINYLLEMGIRNFIVNDTGLVYYLSGYDVNVTLDNITLNTNFESINMWNSYGVGSVVLGREITLSEINEIYNNSNIEVIVHIQGIFPIFTSIRKLLTNYQVEKGTNFTNEQVYLGSLERQAKYPFIENNNGVVMFSNYEQCSIEDLDKLLVKTYLIDQPFVEDEVNVQVVKMYLDGNYQINDIAKISKFKQSRGFFYKKTLYKL